ncbi:MAG: serine hydrolase domain-containing protein [Pseudohongiellaceae bacterium]
MKSSRSTTSLTAVLLLLVLLGTQATEAAQSFYFPGSDADWETIEPQSVAWDPQKLDAALELAGARKSSGVVILHGGRIMAERHWESPDDSTAYRNMLTGRDLRGWAIEDVASAQKSVVAILTGMAQERGFLNLDDPVARYVGQGWSKLTTEQEAAVTIRHLLSMNSGLATDFTFAAAPDTEWLYNTPVYHELMRVLIAATGLDRQALTHNWLAEPLGLTHTAWTDRPWASADIAVGLSTSARELARFGLMIMAGGQWADETIVADKDFLDAMLRPSQQLNPSYGYLWWLNGQDFALASGARAMRREGSLIPAAPKDLVAMQGALDRKLYLMPSLDLVITRLGSNGEVDDSSFNDAFWEALMEAAPRR